MSTYKSYSLSRSGVTDGSSGTDFGTLDSRAGPAYQVRDKFRMNLKPSSLIWMDAGITVFKTVAIKVFQQEIVTSISNKDFESNFILAELSKGLLSLFCPCVALGRINESIGRKGWPYCCFYFLSPIFCGVWAVTDTRFKFMMRYGILDEGPMRNFCLACWCSGKLHKLGLL